MFQLLPSFAGEGLFEKLIGELRVRDGDLAEERADLGIIALLQLRLHLFLGERVDAAHEETGHGRDLVNRQPLRHAAFQSAQIRLHHLRINLVREDERDVDVDAIRDRLLDGRNAFRRGRNLDHHVRPIERGKQPLGLGRRGRGVVRKERRHFEAAEPVATVALVVDGTKDVRGVADVFDGDGVVDLFARFVLRGQAAQLRVVVVAAADRFLENSRIRSQPAQVILVNHPFQIAAGNEAPLHLIEPDALPRFREFNKWIAHQNLRSAKAYRY